MKDFKRVNLFTERQKLDRLTGNGSNGECCTPSRIAVCFRQNHTRQGQRFVKSRSGHCGVLARHRVNYKQGFCRLHLSMQTPDFIHHFIIDSKPAGGIDNQNVTKLFSCCRQCVFGNLQRLLLGSALKKVDVGFGCERSELVYRSGTIDVGANHHDLLFISLF